MIYIYWITIKIAHYVYPHLTNNITFNKEQRLPINTALRSL